MSENLWWLSDESQKMLERGYLIEGQSVQDKINIVAKTVRKYYPEEVGIYERVKEGVEKGWFSLSSPIWANFGEGRGLPISCFSSYISDNMESIYNTLSEVAMMTKLGGGTSGYFGNLRPIGSKVSKGGVSSGMVSFFSLYDHTAEVVSQSGVRRGAFAGYLPVDHPEVMEFLEVQEENSNLQTAFIGVTITDNWMKQLIEGDVEKRKIWSRILEARKDKGIPYIFFKDTVNNNKPQIYKDRGCEIHNANLCSEAILPTNEEESFVCCLLSMNLYLFDEWKDTHAIETATILLDAVMEEFIQKAEHYPHLKRAVKFAKRHRALGIGGLGWHSLLQKKGIVFESLEAQQLNVKVFKYIQDNAHRASEYLGSKYGNAPIFDEGSTKDKPRRNTTLTAVAPTTSSSSILGQMSAGIEPFASNYFVVGLAKGSFPRKNKDLINLLNKKGKNTTDVWMSITKNKGSVNHLDFLTDKEKDVFKTFREISPYSVIQQASARQKYIDQGQSVNIKIPDDVSPKELNKIHLEAWKLGLKTMYYQRGSSVAKEEASKLMSCVMCEA